MAPLSTSIAVICSTYRGLPSAAEVIRCRTGSSRPPRSSATIASESSVESGSRTTCSASCPAAHSARVSKSSWRAVVSSRIGAPCDRVGQVVEELEECRRRDVDVVDDRDERSPVRDRLEQLADPPEQLRGGKRRRGKADGRRHSIDDRSWVVGPVRRAAGDVAGSCRSPRRASLRRHIPPRFERSRRSART